jgi:predicted esterase
MDHEAQTADPHRDQPTMTAGVPLEEASAAMILLHGRGASAENILGLTGEFGGRAFAYLAPQAAGHTWYPHSFLVPLEQNEPYLTSALRLVASIVERVAAAGIPAERVILLGFSQGACLSLEFLARNARRFGGAAALTGGLIGSEQTPRDYSGSLDGTPIFIGSSAPDPHVPVPRVHESAQVLTRIGGEVTTRIYPGMGHTINDDELDHVRSMMDALLAE